MKKRGLGLIGGLIAFFAITLVSTMVWAEEAPPPQPKIEGPFSVEVDYSRSLEHMIAEGHYQWIDPNVKAKNFPLPGKGKVYLFLVTVHFNRYASTKEVLEFLAANNLEPAKIEHLLALSAIYPTEQYQYPILALGSDWVNGEGKRQAPAIGSVGLTTGVKRTLWLQWVDRLEWSPNYRFLAIKK